jgi:predicted  nucleic acid-binding Zn-ribbon protein
VAQVSQSNQAQAQTEDVRGKVSEIVKNIEELNQQIMKLKEVIKNKTLDDELSRLRNITDDMSAWIKKLKTYFTILVLNEGYGEVIVKGRANEVEWVHSYGRLDDLMINKIFDDFFDDARYFNSALQEYTKTIERITHLLPGVLAAINEVKQQLSGLEDRVSGIEDEVEELKDRLEEP